MAKMRKPAPDEGALLLPFDFDCDCDASAAEDAAVPAAAPYEDPRADLRRDFLGRDASFVHQRKTGRLGWETVLPDEGSYSSFVLDVTDEEAILRSAYRIARETLAAMDLPKPVSIRVNKDRMNCTDFDTVYVSTNMFDNGSITTGQKVDIFTGIAVHEGCHLMYTDKEAGLDGDELLHMLLNVVEDERIERILGEDLPGYANFLKMAKYYTFDLFEKELGKEGISDDPVVRLFNAILHFVRYPAALSDADIDDFCGPLRRVRDILSDWPASTAAAFERAKAIYELFKDEASREKPSAGDEGEGEGDGAPSGKDGKGGDGKDREKRGGGKSSKADGASPEKGGGKPEETPGGSPEGDLEEILRKIAGAGAVLTRDPGKGLSDGDLSDAVRTTPEIQGLCEGTVERGERRGAWVVPPTGEDDGDPRDAYLKSLDRVRAYVPAVKKILTSNATDLRYTDRGVTSGRLDTGKLAEAVQGCRGVYVRQGEVRSKRVAVCILIDESGSMNCEYAGGTRIQWARDTAVLLNEGLKDVPNVDLFIYGHSADLHGSGSTEIFTYRDHKERGRYLLGAAKARWQNADGRAIREVAARVRRQTQEECLLFVISDGNPWASGYTGTAGISDTKKAVEEVTRQGFVPVQVAIAPGTNPAEMFRHWVTFEDLRSLPKQLASVIRKAVLKHSGRGGGVAA